MKKILFILVIFLLFVSMPATISIPLLTLSTTGTFEGVVYTEKNDIRETVANISGTYTAVGKLGYRPGKLNGVVTLNDGTVVGTMQAYYRMLIIGRISAFIDGKQKQLPIIGLLGFSKDGELVGIFYRFMSYRGPLYLEGIHQPD